MDSQALVAGLVTIGVGALSGGLTNAIAVWMLFNPHEERRFGPFRLVGAIPKNKPRLARSIGRVVGEKLLTPEDLASRLNSPAIRGAFDEAVGGAIRRWLEEDQGAVLDRLGPDTVATLDRVIADTAPRLASRVGEWADSPGFEDLVAVGVRRLRDSAGSRPIAELLTPERQSQLAERLDRWAADLLQSEELEASLRGWIADVLHRLEQDDRPLVDRLPPGIMGPVEQVIGDALPLLIDRLGELLADPEAKGQVKQALRDAFDASARRMLLHERLIAKLVVSDRTIERLVDGFEAEGFERFAEAVNAPDIRARVSGAIQHGLHAMLREPLGERIRRLPAERRTALAVTLGDWLVAAARTPATRLALRTGLERGLSRAGEWHWAAVIDLLPHDQVARAIAEALGTESGQAWLSDGLASGARALLARPIGRPSEWLGEPTVDRLAAGVSAAAWGWVERQVPVVVEKLSVPEMVEQKVLGFSTRRMEEIIRTVTQRELDLIVRLGYLLGAIVGAIAFGVGQVIRG